MNKKILFFNPYSHWPFHFETDLEIIKQHVDNGDSVTVLTCDGDLLSCEPNPTHNVSICYDCIERRKKGFKLLGLTQKVKFLNFLYLSKDDKKVIAKFPKYPKTLRQLKSLSIEDFDLGLSVASSLIDYLREPYPNPSHHQNFVKENIQSALVVYLSIQNHLRNIKPDKMYIFNGRFAVLRAVMRAAQLLKINFDIHERAGVQGKYSLTTNTYPHDLEKKKSEIQSVWNNSELSESEKIEIGTQWFLDRRYGKDQGWFSFTKEKDVSPCLIQNNKLKIVIFNSSQDEFEAISGWENLIYKNQNQAIFKLASDLQYEQNIDIYLRVHPNLSNINNSQTKALKRLKFRYNNFQIIDAEDLVNSYELLDLADVVITFGSTIGVEAAFYGKISILAGRSLYEDLDTCFKISSHNQLVEIIKNNLLWVDKLSKENQKINAIKYGFYMAMNGIDFFVFKQEGIFDMRLKNLELSEINNSNTLMNKIVRKLMKIALLIKQLKNTAS
jgi:hypothetical protein